MDAITLLQDEKVSIKFEKLLWTRSQQFLSSIISIISQNDTLKNADPTSVYLCAMAAAALDLPIGPMWFAYIIPFRKWDQMLAQFQVWYKWLIQLALRSWQFKTISACSVYKWQIWKYDPLKWIEFNRDNKQSEEVIWYAAYFSLINWFEKTLYMTTEDLKNHWVKFSQTFKKWFWLWKDDFDSMAIKTVLKLLIWKYAPLSIQMQQAIVTDQWLIKNEEMTEIEYIDNQNDIQAINTIDEELLNWYRLNIQACKTKKELNDFVKQNKPTNSTILSIISEHGETLQS